MMYFRCEPLGCGVSVASCGKRYLRVASGEPARGLAGSKEHVDRGGCANCPVGAAHAIGGSPTEWSDGKRIERADSVKGLGYNVHKAEPRLTVSRKRGLRFTPAVRTVAASATDKREVTKPTAQEQCACGAWYTKWAASKRCSSCSAEARRADQRERWRARERKPPYRGEARKTAKLSDEKVRRLRRMWSSGTPKAVIAAEFGVSTQAVHLVIVGKTWTHVDAGEAAE